MTRETYDIIMAKVRAAAGEAAGFGEHMRVMFNDCLPETLEFARGESGAEAYELTNTGSYVSGDYSWDCVYLPNDGITFHGRWRTSKEPT